MCLIAIALGTHPGMSLLLLGNRDEYYDRPSEPAHWWPDQPDILGGRDLRAGGTWLAIRRDGHLAAVTNYRDPANRYAGNRSRGELVRDFLGGHLSPAGFAGRIEGMRSEYAGYSLLFGHAGEIWFFSNRGAAPRRLDAGIYGLSNRLLDSPWPKVSALRERLASLPARAPDHKALFEVLRDTEYADDKDLPDTGVGLDRERALSSAFVQLADYGTRSSTVVSIANGGHVRFEEHSFGPTGMRIGDRKFEFTLDTSAQVATGRHG